MKHAAEKIVSFMVAVLLGFSLFGLEACTTEQPTTESASGAAEEANEVELRALGRETETALALEITNATGKDIIACAVKATQDAEYPASLVTKTTKIVADETIIVYLEPSGTTQPEPALGASSDNPTAGDIILNTLYNVSLTFDDDTTAELHELNLESLAALEVHLSSDGIAYVEFTDNESETGSTCFR